MSHIDSFRHEIVGFFGGIPVYHPLEIIRGDFYCDPSQLVLGGGSGEHPAMVLEDPTAAVALFLDTELTALKNSPVPAAQHPLTAVAHEWLEIVRPFTNGALDDYFTFYDWTDETHENFHALCTSRALPNPCWKDAWKADIRTWLALGFGEFVFFAMPDLAPDLVGQLRDPYAHFRHVRYANILLIPPNMPVYANGGNAFVSKRRPPR